MKIMKSKSIKLITLILLFVHGSIFGCINGETKVLKNGLFIYEDHYGSIPFGHKFNRFNFEKVKKELDSLYKKTNDLDYLSDIGYVLIIEGKYAEALNLYLEIEKKSPNRYSTASNIGTIYELLGDNKKAYFWIEKGIQINPSSHNGSEWLHLKILEAKINAEKNLDSNFIFSTSFGTFNNPQTELSDAKIEKLISDTYYQLNERITFIKDNDIIIANLLFDLGNLCLIENKYHEALQILKMAKEYGLESELLNRRIAYCEGINKSCSDDARFNTTRTYYTNVYNAEKTILLILSIIGFCVLLYYLFKKYRTKK